jgi:uncharacterized protein YkwD
MSRKTVFIKDGFLTVSAVGLFCFLFLIAHATAPEAPQENVVPTTESDTPVSVGHTVSLNTTEVPIPNPSTPKKIISHDNKTEEATIEDSSPAEIETPSQKPISEQITVVEKTETQATPESTPIPLVIQDTNDEFTEELIAHIVDQTNAFRESKNLEPLQYESTLALNATGYSNTMLKERYLSHTSPTGCDLTCRFELNNYKAQAWGENLATLSFSDRPSAFEVASFFVEQWKKSAGHKENLISPAFTHQGIGVAQSENAIYVTVQFAHPL